MFNGPTQYRETMQKRADEGLPVPTSALLATDGDEDTVDVAAAMKEATVDAVDAVINGDADLDTVTKEQLLERAGEMGRSHWSKAEILEALRHAAD